MRPAILASTLLMCACATGAAPRTTDGWQSRGYAGFSESIDALVGPGAIDCGFFVIVSGTPGFGVRRQAYTCVQQALKEGLPFKYGTDRLPMDSFATQVIARSADGKLWSITFDVMINGESAQQWNRICQEVGVDRRTLIINAARCVEKPDGRLVRE